MEGITIRDIVEATGGRLLCGSCDTPVRHVSINSRNMQGDDIFVPIIGARIDAHQFIEGAFAAGAVAVFTSEHDSMEDERPWIRVEDTIQALQDLGRECRRRLTMPFIGITGSVGKTTTREMVTAALSGGKRVFSTAGNSNGQLGVPITLSEVDPQAEITILEMGMSEPGEMARIADIARVGMAIFTNIGVSHIENLGSRENICREKMHITDGFGADSVAILNGDDDILAGYRGKLPFRTVYYGTGEDADFQAKDIHTEGDRTEFTLEAPIGELTISLQVPGMHNVLNALAALAAAAECGVPLELAARKLEDFQGFQRRLQILTRNGMTIIDDSYNASPESMRAALQVLAAARTEGRRIAVLADMLELGPDAPLFHYQTGAYGASLPIDCFFTVGALSRHLAQAVEEAGIPVFSFATNQEAVEALHSWLKQGDTLLLKGSNGMKLGEILKEL